MERLRFRRDILGEQPVSNLGGIILMEWSGCSTANLGKHGVTALP